jgi:hypothetical protein
MNTPGFTAEASLGPAFGLYAGKSDHFRTNRDFIASIASISPQQLSLLGTLSGSDCFGSVDQCIADHCDLDDPRQRAACAKACRQPAVCDPCRCRCSPDCTRTCERECHKFLSTGSGGFVDLTCTEPCSL